MPKYIGHVPYKHVTGCRWWANVTQISRQPLLNHMRQKGNNTMRFALIRKLALLICLVVHMALRNKGTETSKQFGLHPLHCVRLIKYLTHVVRS
jgi:hypothetical protein